MMLCERVWKDLRSLPGSGAESHGNYGGPAQGFQSGATLATVAAFCLFALTLAGKFISPVPWSPMSLVLEHVSFGIPS